METKSLIGAGELFDRTWKVFSKNWWSLSLVSLIPGLAGLLIGMLIAALIVPMVVFMPGVAGLLFVVISLVSLPFILWAGGWIQAATVIASKKALAGETIAVKEVYKEAKPWAWKMFGVQALAGLIALGGFSLLIIPGIMVTFWLFAVGMVLVNEGLGGWTAILKSKYYVTGRWWAVFGRFLLLALIMIVVSMLTAVVGWIPVFGQIVNFVVNIATGVFSSLFVYALYESLKETAVGEFSEKGTTKRNFMLLVVLGVVVPVLTMLAMVIVIAAINPGKQMEKARQMQQELRDRELEEMSDWSTDGGYGNWDTEPVITYEPVQEL